MNHPPSLSPDVLSRAFRAVNGEFGFQLADAKFFLNACEADGIALLGWELWLVDHDWCLTSTSPLLVPLVGSWCGGIPIRGSDLPNVVTGDGDLPSIRQQVAKLSIAEFVQPQWVPYIRINFTVDDGPSL